MARAISIALKTFDNVMTLAKTSIVHRQRSRHGASARPTDEQQRLIFLDTGRSKLIDKMRVDLHARKLLPRNPNDRFVQLRQIGTPDICPFGVGTHVNQHRARIFFEDTPCIVWRYITGISHSQRRGKRYEIRNALVEDGKVE